MADIVVIAYVIGWAMTTVALVISSRWLRSRRRPAPHPFAVSFLAGAAWPLLLLGVVEVAAIAAASKIAPDVGLGVRVIA